MSNSSTSSRESFIAPMPTSLPGLHGQAYPDVMTANEAAQFLRLDAINVKDPLETLNYYRRKGLLKGTQIGKCVRYRRIELERFLDELTRMNPR